SLEIVEAGAAWHGYGAKERDWLHFAALLHDVGSAIAYDGHSQHSAYVVRHGGLRGLTAEEVVVVATVARYHSGARPRKRRGEAHAALPRELRRPVRWLSARLPIAEGVGPRPSRLVREVRVRRRGEKVILVADARGQAQLEVWAARRRAADLARLLDLPVGIATAPAERTTSAPTRRMAAVSPLGATGNGHAGAPRRRRARAAGSA